MSIPESLEGLSKLLEQREHLLALGGDDQISQSALAATKDIADLAISLEQQSHPHLHPFLASILAPQAIELRSSTKKAQEEKPKDPEPEDILPYTPLSMLTTDGMEAEQVWAQLELRNDGLCKVIKEVGPGEMDEEDIEEEEESSVFDENDSTEDMTEEEWNAMMAANGYAEGDSASGSEDEDGSDISGLSGSEDETDEWVSVRTDDPMLDDMSDEEDEEDEDDEDDEDEEEEENDDEDDDDGDDGSDDASGAEDDVDAPSAPGPSAGPSKSRARHPTLDDQFFSIDDFNRQTEEMEASRVTSGALGGDEDDEVDLEDVSSMFLKEADEDADIMFSDFFDAPSAPPKGKSEGKKSKGKKRSVAFAEEEEEEEDDGADEAPEEARGVMDRVKADLFDDEEEEEDDQPLSTHERRQRELAEQIAQLESEAIGPKDWTLLGEATARARPENSLLEEDLDFEHVAKSVPQVTEESVATLEELIKKRILDNNFDSPVRVRAYEPNAFLPSRFFELDDKQSAKSLAQIYEDDFQASASGGKVVDVRDEKLRKEHEEIDRLWSEVCYKLDALSSLNFVPKAPKAQITTIDNIATTSMETALPSSQAASTMLAPHELFAGPSKGELVARSEQTPEEAKAARGKARKHKKAERARLDATAQLYGKKRKSVREEKDEALKHLVKSGKGVTILGKGSKEDAKRKQRDEAAPDAKRLKL